MIRTLAPLLLLLAACTGDDDPVFDPDRDGDGFPASVDCNDEDPDAYPGAIELCDEADNDCNGVVDDDYAEGASLGFVDVDGDGYGDPTRTLTACALPDDHVDNGDDCNDSDEDIRPGADELCDRVDNDCDGAVDEDAVDTTGFFEDRDEDGFGRPGTARSACEAPAGYVDNDDDCNDNDAAINPETVWLRDADEDGFGLDGSETVECAPGLGWALRGGDCDDGTARRNPDRDEVCDELDNDCDGVVDTLDGACDAWPGTYAVRYRMQAQEKIGSSVINDMQCLGSGNVTVRYDDDPPVQARLTCAQARYRGFDSNQPTTLEAEVYPDGTVVGRLVHTFNSYARDRGYDASGSLDGGLSVDGTGRMRPNAMSAGDWQVTFTLDEVSSR